MPYIIREDGINFVIPSYRDVLTAKRKPDLMKEVTTLSHSYGEYISIGEMSDNKYSVSLSLDSGYLLGETVWHYFNRPEDLIYCEAVPNSNEVILVVVKNGSVYLDGSFPAESVPEELVIFLTQQNNFEIYTHGNVPIGEKPAEGVFCFDAASVKSFTVLERSAFNELPLIPAYQLRLISVVLEEYGSAPLPIKKILMVIVLALIPVGLYFLWGYLTPPPPPEEEIEPNPYQLYVDSLRSPQPEQEVTDFVKRMKLFYAAPGWYMQSISYSDKNYSVKMVTKGATIDSIMEWAHKNRLVATIRSDGVYLDGSLSINGRAMPRKIYPMKQIMTIFIDRLQKVYPLTGLTISNQSSSDSTRLMNIKIALSNVTPTVIGLIGEQLVGLPLTSIRISLRAETSQTLNGTIDLVAMGS